MDNRNILHAWEKFVENGTSPGAVRGIVAASWERSHGYHVPVGRGETRLAPEGDLIQHRAENADLIQYGAQLRQRFLGLTDLRGREAAVVDLDLIGLRACRSRRRDQGNDDGEQPAHVGWCHG